MRPWLLGIAVALVALPGFAGGAEEGAPWIVPDLAARRRVGVELTYGSFRQTRMGDGPTSDGPYTTTDVTALVVEAVGDLPVGRFLILHARLPATRVESFFPREGDVRGAVTFAARGVWSPDLRDQPFRRLRAGAELRIELPTAIRSEKPGDAAGVAMDLLDPVDRGRFWHATTTVGFEPTARLDYARGFLTVSTGLRWSFVDDEAGGTSREWRGAAGGGLWLGTHAAIVAEGLVSATETDPGRGDLRSALSVALHGGWRALAGSFRISLPLDESTTYATREDLFTFGVDLSWRLD